MALWGHARGIDATSWSVSDLVCRERVCWNTIQIDAGWSEDTCPSPSSLQADVTTVATVESFVSTSAPHDALFKSVFEQPEHAAAELQHVLPTELVAAIDWRTLALEPGSFVDEDLAERHTDLLFSAQAGERVLVYLLFEHQSTMDAAMPLRLLRYMVRIWTRHLETQPGQPLPLIIPALLAQVPGGWTVPRRFSAMFSAPAQELGNAVLPEFAYAVDDLHRISDDGLRSRALPVEATLALWAMRDARDRAATRRHLAGWADEFEALARTPGGEDAISLLLRYIASTSGDLQLSEFRDILGGRAPTAEAISMTIAELLESQYLAKRDAEARLAAEAEARLAAEAEALATMKEMLFALLGARDVLVDHAGRARILGCTSAETLKDWHVRAARAERLEDVFDE